MHSMIKCTICLIYYQSASKLLAAIKQDLKSTKSDWGLCCKDWESDFFDLSVTSVTFHSLTDQGRPGIASAFQAEKYIYLLKKVCMSPNVYWFIILQDIWVIIVIITILEHTQASWFPKTPKTQEQVTTTYLGWGRFYLTIEGIYITVLLVNYGHATPVYWEMFCCTS